MAEFKTIKTRLAGGSVSFTNKDGVFITYTSKNGDIEVPENVYKKHYNLFERAEEKAVVNNVTIQKAVAEATANMISKEDYEKAVAEAKGSSFSIEDIETAAEAVEKMSNKDKVIASLIEELTK